MTFTNTTPGYGAFPYGTLPYGTDGGVAYGGTQVNIPRRFANEINPPSANGQPNPIGATQATVLKNQAFGTQARIVNYNTNKLRVLCDYISRGASAVTANLNEWGQFEGTGLNWDANHTEVSPTNDFDINNLNNDIVESVWRSPLGTLATPSVLICDTEVGGGASFDTLSLLNTNLTTSGSVNIEASNDPLFPVPVPIAGFFGEEDGNVIWISDTLPLNTYRFYRFTIFDPSNLSGQIQIGTAVFGNAVIFSTQCFVDQVQWNPTHFTNAIPIEGQTTVQNDLGIKNKLRLAFRSWEFSSSDYVLMKRIFANARTDLKCLWVPTPQYPKRFGIYGKMTTIPSENHNAKSEDADYVDFSVEINEAK